jgi:phosphoribosyl 1,2-cyclic phosphodiesterase
MELSILGSSSKGNCYILQDSDEALIIEAGIKLIEAKKALGWNISKVSGLIVSHQHNDHAGFASEYAHAGIPVLALPEVIRAKEMDGLDNVRPIRFGKGFIMGRFKILPFPLLHDVPIAGFIIEHPDTGRIFFATDTYAIARRADGGIIPYTFGKINHYMIEANYCDEELDKNIDKGFLPYFLKKRLMVSHMEIGNTIDFLKRSDLSMTKDILLIHLSSENSNESDFVRRTRMALGKRVYAAKPGMNLNYNLRL